MIDYPCEVCGYDGGLVRENVGKDAINRYCLAKRKAEERMKRVSDGIGF